MTIAEGGLARRNVTDISGRDETVYLATIKKLVMAGKTPSDVLLEGIADEPSLVDAIIRRTKLSPAART